MKLLNKVVSINCVNIKNHGDQEPFAFGSNITNIIRKFIEVRYQLLPYLYTAFWKYVNDGVPILKPLVLFD